jgi:hypothetical protein
MEWKYTYYSNVDLIISKIEGHVLNKNMYFYFERLMTTILQLNSKRVIVNLTKCNFDFTIEEIFEASGILQNIFWFRSKIEVYFISTDPKQTAYLLIMNEEFKHTNISFEICSTLEKPFIDFSISMKSKEIEQVFNAL